jgi:hypothetical protein
MRAQVSSIVGVDLYPVAVTLTPCSAAAAMSIEAFPGPVEAINLSRGRRWMMSRGNGVRSRMTQTTSKGRSLSIMAAGSAI